jgi:hypothetical protein
MYGEWRYPREPTRDHGRDMKLFNAGPNSPQKTLPREWGLVKKRNPNAKMPKTPPRPSDDYSYLT